MSQNRLLGREAYALAHASERPDERARLDSIHEAMTACFGGKLTLAPLETNSPISILEIGAGSGAWAEHAAKTFPEADILAVDLADVPRTLPANVRFHKADFTQPFEFQPDQFEVVHARLFFINLPNSRTHLERTLHLVKPGGWLILEDVDNDIYNESSELSPGISKTFATWKEILKERDINTRFSTEYESFLKGSGAFSEVNVIKLCAPVSGQTDDPVLRQFGSTARNALNSIYSQAPRRLSDPRLTQDMAEKAVEELYDDSLKLRLDFYFIWARKRL